MFLQSKRRYIKFKKLKISEGILQKLKFSILKSNLQKKIIYRLCIQVLNTDSSKTILRPHVCINILWSRGNRLDFGAADCRFEISAHRYGFSLLFQTFTLFWGAWGALGVRIPAKTTPTRRPAALMGPQ